MMDLKKLLALGACSFAFVACGDDTSNLSEETDALVCPAGDGTDGTVPAVTTETDGGPVETCPEAPIGGAGGEGGAGGAPVGGNGEPPAPVAAAEWTDSKTLTLTISEHADLGPYGFGFAETGNGGGDGWDGEDCIPGVEDDYDLCHEVPEAGVLTLTSVHPDEGGSIDDLVESETTLMNGPRAAGLTYVLIRGTEDSNCWTWGHNPQHYIDELGCNNLAP